MKHLTILLALLTLNSSLFTLSASAAVPLKWTVETSRLAPAVFDVVRGETIALEAAFNSSGKPFAMDGEPVSIFWQTNGMGSAWWTAPAVATSNLVRATFTPEMDPGAATVNGFLGSSGSIYRAAFTFRFRHGPGAVPNTLPLPVPVIDFAKVRVLNPPWPGGGGGSVDTNAVIDIIHKTVDGSARTLPPYLHYLEMDDTYPDAAAEWYAQADYSHGSCSARRTGNLLERNYDWNFDFMPEFVVRTVAASATGAGTSRRFASLSVCNVGTNLTEADVNSGKWSKWYKALPGHAVDGINSEGVVAEVNVVSTNGVENWHGDPESDGIHCLGAVRWVLDHATNAQHGAEVLAELVYVPAGYGNFHYMIADATSTYIVENGEAHLVTGATGVPPVAVLTNFRLYPARDTSGEGQERYDALASGANITSQWWTLTYTPDGYRTSDLPGIDTNLLFRAWAATPKESHRGETFRSQPLNFSTSQLSWWQTVHTSVYDISNRVLRICVSENPDWYVFALPGATGVSPVAVREIVEPMIAAATNGVAQAIAAATTNKFDKDGGTIRGSVRIDSPMIDEYDDFNFLRNKITFSGRQDWGFDDVVVGWQDPLAEGPYFGIGGIRIDTSIFGPEKGSVLFSGAACVNSAGNLWIGAEPLDFYLSLGNWNTSDDPFARKSDIPTTVRTYDSVRQCWWVLEMVNGVPTWTVED